MGLLWLSVVMVIWQGGRMSSAIVACTHPVAVGGALLSSSGGIRIARVGPIAGRFSLIPGGALGLRPLVREGRQSNSLQNWPVQLTELWNLDSVRSSSPTRSYGGDMEAPVGIGSSDGKVCARSVIGEPRCSLVGA